MRWIVCVLLCAATSAWAIEPRLEPATVNVALDEYFYLQVHISDAEGADCQIEFPNQKQFEIVKAGISQSQSIQVIGQQVERSHTWIHNFRLRAKEAGDFVYGPARVTMAGHSYTTGTSAIHVRSERFTPGQGRGGLMDFFSPEPFVRNDGRIAIHVETVFDKGTAWVGEGVVQYVDIYASRPRITGVQFAQIARDGFWEILPEKFNQGRPQRVTRDGKEWYRYRYPVAWLFPLTSGERVIPPFAVRVDYDQFWMRSQVFQTEPLRLMVLPLPAGAGRFFSGAVGNFEINARLEEPADGFVKDKPFTLILTVSGAGNIRSLQAPSFSENPDFRIMPPQHTTEVQIKDGRVSGYQSYRYFIYPLRTGMLTLPEAKLEAFDPIQAKYYNLAYTLPPLVITPSNSAVKDEEKPRVLPQPSYDFSLPESDFPPNSLPLALPPAMLLLLGAAGFLFCGIIRDRKRRQALLNPERALRLAAAGRARKAFRHIGDDPQKTASDLVRILRLYASDRTGAGEGSAYPALARALAQDGVSEDCLQEWKSFEDQCAELSYGMGQADCQTLLESAAVILRRFEESRS